MAFPAFFDACVIYGARPNDLVLRLGDSGAFRPLWSEDMLDQVRRNAIGDGYASDEIDHRLDMMRAYFSDARPPGSPPLATRSTRRSPPTDRRTYGCSSASSDTMTQHAGVVRSGAGLTAGLAELSRIEERMDAIGEHPDVDGHQDLAHAFDLKSSALAARATMDAALERREIRGCHNRSDYPELDPSLQVNMVWSGLGTVEREPVAPIPSEITVRMREVSAAGKLVE